MKRKLAAKTEETALKIWLKTPSCVGSLWIEQHQHSKSMIECVLIASNNHLRDGIYASKTHGQRIHIVFFPLSKLIVQLNGKTSKVGHLLLSQVVCTVGRPPLSLSVPTQFFFFFNDQQHLFTSIDRGYRFSIFYLLLAVRTVQFFFSFISWPHVVLEITIAILNECQTFSTEFHEYH